MALTVLLASPRSFRAVVQRAIAVGVAATPPASPAPTEVGHCKEMS